LIVDSIVAQCWLDTSKTAHVTKFVFLIVWKKNEVVPEKK
jgi:hypothetical protein